jgi:hypothetical protein
MKLKEIPVSWWAQMCLQRLSMAELQRPTDDILPVIVSLTSIPSRLNLIHITIRSLLNQIAKPEKIILWLNEKLQNQLPDSLTQLQGRFFEIRFVDLECSHRKLIHSLEAFPEKIIATGDDDVIYARDWLLRLYRDHQQFPRDIIAHECRRIAFDAQGEPLPYKEWITETASGTTDKWMMPIGYGGVLYPSHSLHADVQNRELFLQLTPRADDLWFKAMSHRAGTTTRRCSNPVKKPIPIIGSQQFSLQKTNVKQDGNYLQWKAVCDFYGFNLL